jgi:hypothetical protein
MEKVVVEVTCDYCGQGIEYLNDRVTGFAQIDKKEMAIIFIPGKASPERVSIEWRTEKTEFSETPQGAVKVYTVSPVYTADLHEECITAWVGSMIDKQNLLKLSKLIVDEEETEIEMVDTEV